MTLPVGVLTAMSASPFRLQVAVNWRLPVPTHTPEEQARPSPQTLSQAPQLLLSVLGSTQASPQTRRGGSQTGSSHSKPPGVLTHISAHVHVSVPRAHSSMSVQTLGCPAQV